MRTTLICILVRAYSYVNLKSWYAYGDLMRDLHMHIGMLICICGLAHGCLCQYAYWHAHVVSWGHAHMHMGTIFFGMQRDHLGIVLSRHRHHVRHSMTQHQLPILTNYQIGKSAIPTPPQLPLSMLSWIHTLLPEISPFAQDHSSPTSILPVIASSNCLRWVFSCVGHLL